MDKCVVCNVKILRRDNERPSVFAKREICSLKCRQTHITQKKKDKFIPSICRECGEEIHTKSKAGKRSALRKFCGQECFRKWNRGPNISSWKGGRKKSGEYIQILIGKDHPFADLHGYVMEHRIVVEEYLREQNPDSEFLTEINGEKFLNRGVIVHHKNNNKHDNHIDNLVPLLSQKEHFHYSFCPKCTHCIKSSELLENPARDNQQPS